MKYSIVLPVYNEENIIQQSIENIIDVFIGKELHCEIITVDDGSTDNSTAILKELQNKYPQQLKIITHPYNKGNGATIKTGIKQAVGDFIICMDSDGQHDPNDVLKMLPYLDEYDLVVGARPFKRDGTWYRNLANKFYNWLASTLTGFDIKDLTSGFRIFRADVVKKFYHLFPQRFSYPTTSTLALLKSGYNIKYVPINIQPRQAGASKIKLFKDGFQFTTIIFKIIVLFEPMKVFLPISLASFLLALIAMIISIAQVNRLYIPNSTVILFVLGILTFLLGLLAEHLTAIQMAIIEDD
ncbi:MAG: glycosyltransferase family 2 protein [Chloroflexota bacterium]|jgi:glycosyltransferase involved in cell wall biosynthesis|nr:glycosyltransferase family 2 protein [Chloroflexota bacterium]